MLRLGSPTATMSKTEHDTLAYRLTQILLKLNKGEKLKPQALADEFGVALRTIQRDLNVRLATLPLERVTDGTYHLSPAYLGQLTLRDLERFAGLAGVRGLFPTLADPFLRDLFDHRLPQALLVKGHHYEDLAGKGLLFQQLEQAIRTCHCIGFDYQKPECTKRYAEIRPYKLINHGGIWYLAATDMADAGKLKSFAFGKVSRLLVADGAVFEPDSAIEQRLQREDGIWLSEDKQEVVLQVAPCVAGYFMRRALIAEQVLERELDDGSLVFSTQMAHPNQILPIVRYWLPHVRILSPPGLQAEMEAELRAYLDSA
jgi:predicted DNA-binding transcriptional regulator YafY